MNKTQLKKFKRVFEEQRKSLLFSDRVISEDFSVREDDRFDEIDQASADLQLSMQVRLRNREALYIKKVDEALRRIEDGTFGQCTECEEDIELRRLEARPTANLCVGCKEDQERREVHTAVGQQHKSLGEAFSRKFA